VKPVSIDDVERLLMNYIIMMKRLYPTIQIPISEEEKYLDLRY
jgi:hypothetical protein